MTLRLSTCLVLVFLATLNTGFAASSKQSIRAAYVPLADHYAAIVAYEKYRSEMQYADFTLEQIKNWDLLAAYFRSEKADLAFIMSPLAMELYSENPNFRWVSLMHRNGTAMAVNRRLAKSMRISGKYSNRSPNISAANGISITSRTSGFPIEVAVPHLKSTHTLLLYKYLKDNGKTLGIGRTKEYHDAIAVAVPPSRSPGFIAKRNKRGRAAALVQSLPWSLVSEIRGSGHVAWFSKDVLSQPNGHLDCIAIAPDTVIRKKNPALREVIHFIHKAGHDIEIARAQGGKSLLKIAEMVRKHIPGHDTKSIVHSLNKELDVINYRNLNIDETEMQYLMELATESGVLKRSIDIGRFADKQFYVDAQ